MNKNVHVIKITAYVSPYMFIKTTPSKLVICANITL